MPLGLPAASATDAAIQRKIFWSVMPTLIISNEEVHDIMKKVKSLEYASLFNKRR